MLEMEATAVLNFSTAFSSSSNSTNEGLAGIFGGRCIPSDLGIPVTTSNITPQPVFTSYRTVNANSGYKLHVPIQETHSGGSYDWPGFLSAFCSRGGQNQIVWIIGGKYVSVCKACSKVGGSGGMLPREMLIWTI